MAEIREYLKAKSACARQDLEEVLGRLKEIDLPWSPREGMPTIAGLLLEIANKEKEVLGWVRSGVWPDDEPDAFDVQTTRIDEIRAALAALRLETYNYIDSLNNAQLEQPISNPNRWYEALRLADCPRSEVLGSIATHESYHTGQLVTYLWLRGDTPNEW